jgi:DNA-binding transcriptional MerR regulator
VLRYWEQEFTQLKPVKRRGNRRYYQHHEVLLIRRIRDLLYEQGFTINGARHRLESDIDAPAPSTSSRDWLVASGGNSGTADVRAHPAPSAGKVPDAAEIRQALEEIRQLLGLDS